MNSDNGTVEESLVCSPAWKTVQDPRKRTRLRTTAADMRTLVQLQPHWQVHPLPLPAGHLPPPSPSFSYAGRCGPSRTPPTQPSSPPRRFPSPPSPATSCCGGCRSDSRSAPGGSGRCGLASARGSSAAPAASRPLQHTPPGSHHVLRVDRRSSTREADNFYTTGLLGLTYALRSGRRQIARVLYVDDLLLGGCARPALLHVDGRGEGRGEVQVREVGQGARVVGDGNLWVCRVRVQLWRRVDAGTRAKHVDTFCNCSQNLTCCSL